MSHIANETVDPFSGSTYYKVTPYGHWKITIPSTISRVFRRDGAVCVARRDSQIVLQKELILGRVINFGIYAVASVVFGALYFFRETKATRSFQVASLVLFGVLITALVTPGEIGGDLMFVIAYFLAYKYGQLADHPFWKTALFIGILLGTRIFIVIYDDTIALQKTVGQAIFSIASIPILYWIFEDESKRVAAQKRELERRVKKDLPFVEFGKNIGGIVHDLKNDLGLFSMFGQLLMMNKGETISDRQLEEYQRYVHRFSDRIERILLVTRIRHDEKFRKTEIVSLLRSVLYVFQTNLDFRRVVHFTFQHSHEQIYVETIPVEVVSIMENVVRNSCEALVDHYGDDPQAISRATLLLQCTVSEHSVTVTVKDNGPGIPSCANCRSGNCLECSEFELGTTTKETGNGIGLITVKSAARRIGVSVCMKSEEGRGVTTEIAFPLSEALTAEFPQQYTRNNQNN